ncbi:hypothetical protein [Lutispora thermophila]|uniref:DUF2953 domain-containing protein n=1 Tax=Lutispora thermophila DSM 19022 TaxID=1122184 RepID=A0A1M6CJC8_9FIRM|nr:hypothetical protein [Lutispora thermophila]SHI60798.1 hypothetical protein SAMN02745176_00795 [Lutispora thermophila DSM 19022]
MAVLIFIGKFLLILLIILIALIVLLLSVPFGYYINLKYEQGVVINIKVLWGKLLGIKGTYDNMAGFVAKIIIFNREKSLNAKKDTEDKSINIKKNKDKHEKNSKLNIKELLDKSFLQEIISYIKKVVAIIKPKVINGKFVFGFDDPSITGCLSGLLYYLNEILPKADFHGEPVFDQEIVFMDMNIEGKIILSSIVIEFIKLVLKKDVRRKLKNLKNVETFG